MKARHSYAALGDSMSISYYPDIDATTRFGRRFTNLGAARILCENNDALFPEFKGNDLRSHYQDIEIDDLASDGATIPSVESQLRRLSANTTLITITVGGNDLLGAYGSARSLKDLAASTKEISTDFTKIVQSIRSKAPDAFLILTTVYDPTDGTRRLPGSPDLLPIEFLHQLNDHIKRVASRTANAALADVHDHFLGHGVTAPVSERWYWSESIIEPGFFGAGEIRRLWWRTIADRLSPA